MHLAHPLAIVLLAAAAFPALCAPRSAAELHAELGKHVPGLKIEDVRPSTVPGLFEIRMGEGSAYVTADGKYLIRGDLFEIATRTNLSDAGRSTDRRALLAQ